ncbi:universal stress protein [Candidatus Bathyarchaeota archaeon]|nr:universal stress protein [Candidatus Bathyarchaeota archaeon]
MKEKMKILVGIDGSDSSTWALMEAISIAKKFSGHVTVITVYKRGNKNEADKTQLKVKQLLEEEQIDSSLSSILGSNPSRALVDAAENEKFDLIVVGSRGLGSAASFLLGSVSKQVVTKANCDVLVVKK